jgi:class 3 adenylate cyclase
MATLTDFFSAVSSLAERFAAVTKADFGESIVVVFDDPSQALAMADALEAEMADRVVEWWGLHGLRLEWGAGVAVGEVLIGSVALEGRRQCQVIGEAVDRALALCREAPAGGVVVDWGVQGS